MKKNFLLLHLLVFISGCSSVFYYPARDDYMDPHKLYPPPEQIVFTSADGTKLHGWFFKPKQGQPKGMIVHFHGNAQNLTTHFQFLVRSVQKGYSYFIFDYRGYGHSDGSPEPQSVVEDGVAALRWAAARDPKAPKIVVGQSIGGAIAVRSIARLKNEIPLRLLVIDSSFSNYRSVAKSVMMQNWITFPLAPVAWLIVDNSQEPAEAIADLAPIPLLVVHGDQDQVVPLHLGEKLFARAREPKEFWSVPGGRHTDFLFRREFNERFYEKLEKAVQ